MATFIPTLEEMKQDTRLNPTAGEMELLHILEGLDDSFEVYFQPHIAFDNPDIVILREGAGVYIIEVKDYQLELYHHEKDKSKFGKLYLTSIHQETVDPFQQVWGYKNNLLESFPTIYEKYILNPEKLQFVYTGVFYSAATSQRIKDLYAEASLKNECRLIYSNWTKKQEPIRFWGNDTTDDICPWISQTLKPTSTFNKQIYDEYHTFFLPSRELKEQGTPLIIEDTNLLALSNCVLNPNIKQKDKRSKCYAVTGAAGSGKTLMLARKAVECYSYRKTPVLILTYNVTLKHYLADKIALCSGRKLSRKQIRDNFDIIHFDAFLSTSLKKINIVPPGRSKTEEDEDYVADEFEIWRQECIRLLQANKDKIKRRYNTILFDEGQDFNTSWIQMIYDLFFVKSTGEMVMAWDQKQKIYEERKLEPEALQKIFPNIVKSDPKYMLSGGMRFDPRIVEFANGFQKSFLANRHGEPNFCDTQLTINDSFEESEIRYVSIANTGEAFEKDFVDCFRKLTVCEKPTSPNDIGIICSRIETLRHIEKQLRDDLKIQTVTTFEQEETYQKLLKYYHVNQEGISEKDRNTRHNSVKEECKRLQRIKKDAFMMNPGVTKMSTVHSFKGWEIDTLFVIIEPKDTYEMIYTAITRAKRRLIIITREFDPQLDLFFRKHADCANVEHEELPF